MAKGGVTQNVPADGGADAGWGHKPTEWGDTLNRIIKDRQSACRVDSAQFGRKQRPVDVNVDCTEWGAKMLSEMSNTTIVDVFVKNVIKSPRDKQDTLPIGAVSEGAANLLALIGVKVAGKQVALDHDCTIHLVRNHSSETEHLRGQIPITAGDIAAFAEIFNAAQLRDGDPPINRDKTPCIAGIAYLNGFKYEFATSIRKRYVVPKTLYKWKMK
jgi:hypothetical protein